MSTLVQIATIATPIVLATGFYFAWRQFDAIRKARMAEIVLMLYERWDSPLLEEARRKLNELGTETRVKEELKKADRDNSPELYPLIRVGNFFDTLGKLVSEGYLDKDTAYELTGTAFETYKQLYSAILRDPDLKDYLKCFKALDEIFTKIKADRSKTKVRPT